MRDDHPTHPQPRARTTEDGMSDNTSATIVIVAALAVYAWYLWLDRPR